MLLIAALLLSLPAASAAWEAGGGPGGPGAGPGAGAEGPDRPGTGPGRSEDPGGAGFNGSLSATISFPFAGGSDDSLRLDMPGGCVVLNATLRLEGRSALPPPVDRKATFADTENNRAWSGVSEDSPPTGGPGNFQANQFDGTAYSAVSRQDGSYTEIMTWGFGSPYHMFRFRVAEDVVTSLSVKYVGAGYDWLLMNTDLQLYIYNSGRWSNIGGVSGFGPDSTLVTLKKTIQSPSGCIDSSGNVYILAMGPDGWIFSFLDSDYIELSVKGSDYVWPTDLDLDIGADGEPELEYPGALKGQTILGSETLVPPLQDLVDGAGAPGRMVPLRFSSRTGGVLAVKGHIEIDLPPVLEPLPEQFIDEDVPGWALVDLDRFCRDDRDARPAYEVEPVDREGEVECLLNASGHHLDFCPTAPNWSGRREFELRALDSSGLSAVAFFNVTVRPVNDPPVLFQVSEQTAYEDQPFTLIFKAFDVDDPQDNLTFSDDLPIADVDSRTGALSLTPTNDQVGRYRVNITVEDPSGASATMAFNLIVENVNDQPVLDCEEYLFATEDERFEYEPSALDIDAGDTLEFSLESDISGLEADNRTGEISFTFRNEHVGEHQLELVVADSAGATDRRDILLWVENVNDPPVIEEGSELSAVEDEEFEYVVEAQDVDQGDRLEYSTDHELVAIDEWTGLICFTPQNDDVGRHRFTVTVTDRTGETAQARFTLVVENVNDPPAEIMILSPLPGAKVREGEPVVLSATASDPDAGDVLVFVWREGEIVLGRGANLTAKLRPGKHLVTLEVSDGTANETASVELVVMEAEAGPFGLTAALTVFGLPLALLAAAVIAAVVMSRRKGKGRGGRPDDGRPPLPPIWPPPPGPEPPSWGTDPRAPPPHGQQLAGAPARQPPAGMYQPPVYPPSHSLAGPYQQAAVPPAYPVAGQFQPPPPQMDRPPQGQPFTQTPASQPWAPPRPADMAVAGTNGYGAPPGAAGPPARGPPPETPRTTPQDSARQADREERPSSEGGGLLPEGPAWKAPPPPGGPRHEADERPPVAAGGGLADDPLGEAREVGRRHNGRAGGPGARRRRADESVVTREEMRAAINGARHIVSAARAAGLNPSDAERLLSEATAASYRQEYARSRDLARRCESMALALLEAAARDEERRGFGPEGEPDDEPPEDGAEEAA